MINSFVLDLSPVEKDVKYKRVIDSSWSIKGKKSKRIWVAKS